MRRTLPLPLLAAAAILALPAVASLAVASDLHFGLSRSAPEDGSSVASLDEVRMWFTQVPQEGSLSARVIDASGEPVAAPQARQDAEDGKIFHVALEDGLPAGAYTVAWRGIGQDGHVVRGDFGFTVTGETAR